MSVSFKDCLKTVSDKFFPEQDTACSALALASCCSATGGFSSGTGRGGKIVSVISLWVGLFLAGAHGHMCLCVAGAC